MAFLGFIVAERRRLLSSVVSPLQKREVTNAINSDSRPML